MFQLFVSILLFGSTLSHLEFEEKSIEKIETEDIETYHEDAQIVYNQNQLELEYLNHPLRGTMMSPAKHNERWIYPFQYETRATDDDTIGYALIEVHLSDVLAKEASEQLLADSIDFNEVEEGLEWRIFQFDFNLIKNTHPNEPIVISQRDIIVDTGMDAPPIKYPKFENMLEDTEIYETGEVSGYFAKLVPINQPFLMHFQFGNDVDEYIVEVDSQEMTETTFESDDNNELDWLLENIDEQEEQLSTHTRIFDVRHYQDNVGTYVNPANINEPVSYHYISRGDGGEGQPVEMTMSISEIMAEEDTFEILQLVETDVSNEYKWIVFEFNAEINQVGFPDAQYFLRSRDFQIFVDGAPYHLEDEATYNSYFFEEEEVFEGSRFEGKIAKKVPIDKNYQIVFGTGINPTNVFWDITK